MKVYCEHCGKELFNTNKENKGAIASEAQLKGYVAKLPLFYGVPEFKIFCSKECYKSWSEENITPEQRMIGNEHVSKLKEDILSEKKLKELQNELAEIKNLFNKIKNK